MPGRIYQRVQMAWTFDVAIANVGRLPQANECALNCSSSWDGKFSDLSARQKFYPDVTSRSRHHLDYYNNMQFLMCPVMCIAGSSTISLRMQQYQGVSNVRRFAVHSFKISEERILLLNIRLEPWPGAAGLLMYGTGIVPEELIPFVVPNNQIVRSENALKCTGDT